MPGVLSHIMTVPSGLKSILKRTAPAALRGRGKFRGFVRCEDGKRGPKLKGLTKRLSERIFSNGTFPTAAIKGEWRGGAWSGADGGRRRGAAVDAQVSRMVNTGKAPKSAFVLSKIVLAALAELDLQPVLSQRTVAHKHVGSAIDILAFDASNASLVVIELKCGCGGEKTLAAESGHVACKMKSPLGAASDCVLHRHFAQLAATLAMFEGEVDMLSRIQALGVHQIQAMLVYVNRSETAFYTLPNWWKKRSVRILQAL